MPRAVDHQKHLSILSLLGSGKSQAQVISELSCSYSTITQAKSCQECNSSSSSSSSSSIQPAELGLTEKEVDDASDPVPVPDRSNWWEVIGTFKVNWNKCPQWIWERLISMEVITFV